MTAPTVGINASTGVTIDTPGITVTDSTTSSSTEGGSIRLVSDDGAVMGDGHRLGIIEFGGAEDSSNTIHLASKIEAIVNNNSGNWDSNDCGTDIVFSSSGFSGVGIGGLGKEVKEIMRLSRENLNNNLIFGEGISSTISSGTVLNTQAGRGLFINAGHVTDGGDNDLDGGTLTLSAGAGKGVVLVVTLYSRLLFLGAQEIQLVNLLWQY